MGRGTTLDLLQKALLQEVGKGKRLKGKGKITNLSPLSPSPFPDFCKKSIVVPLRIRLFYIFNPGNELYTVLGVLKRLGKLAANGS
ncbi:hypothetical protein NIES25_61680 (plasmid) [Nostoc linckia NIES-25]|nr:hypothetical protein NIES25_61680 [Nostoc linckia NIES-25]